MLQRQAPQADLTAVATERRLQPAHLCSVPLVLLPLRPTVLLVRVRSPAWGSRQGCGSSGASRDLNRRTHVNPSSVNPSSRRPAVSGSPGRRAGPGRQTLGARQALAGACSPQQ
jgi:hypothetical protein